MPGRSTGGGSGGGRMTGVVPGGGATTGPEATVCNSSANETEGVRGRDLRVVTTGIESPVGAERA